MIHELLHFKDLSHLHKGTSTYPFTYDTIKPPKLETIREQPMPKPIPLKKEERVDIAGFEDLIDVKDIHQEKER